MEKKSIMSFFTTIIIVIIISQTLIQVSMLIGAGVFQEAKKTSYESFTYANRNRKDFLEKEISLHWTKLQPYIEGLQEKLKGSPSEEEIIDLVMEDLINLLRGTGTTGSFIILGDPKTSRSYQSLYLRDYDPITNSSDNSDIYLRYGPSHLASKYKLPLDANWQRKFHINEKNEDFYKTSYISPQNYMGTKYMGYWSSPFKLNEEDIEIVTYSLPLQDKEGEVVGVLGIEVSINYLYKFMPSAELKGGSSLGYMIVEKNPEDGKLYPSIIASSNLEEFIDRQNPIEFISIDKDLDIYLLQNNKMPIEIYASISRLNLYSYKSPYEKERYLISISKGKDLLLQVNKFSKVLNTSLLTTLVFGIIAGIVGSAKMSKPVLDLVHQVAEHDRTKNLYLNPTGLTELDKLSKAIVETNKAMIDSASRISRVIEMVDLPMVVFEIYETEDIVLVTDNFKDFFSGYSESSILETKEKFLDFIKKIKKNPEPEEENIYRLDPSLDIWVSIEMKTYDKQTYGVIQDVSDEIMEKRQIKLDRDLDPLTQISNRQSFKTQYYDWHSNRSDKIAAFFMFDLDDLKLINDSYGHKWGDFYIKEAVKRLQEITDCNRYILGRRSGDEFIMLLYDFETRQEIRNLISSFYEKLGMNSLALPKGGHANIEISAGFVWVGRRNYRFETLLEEADKIMYYTKRHNKGYFTEGNKELLKDSFGEGHV